MFKKQLKFQKLVCLLVLFSAVIVFIYSLGIMTDLYDSLYSTMRNPYDLTQTDVDGSLVYYLMQEFNNSLMKCGIALILIACLLYITNTHIRRIYYVGNYFSVALAVVANLAVAIWAHSQIIQYKALFLLVDFDALKAFSELWNTAYTESTFWFDIHYLVFAITIIACVLLVVNTVWKAKMVREERALLRAGKGAAA